MKVSSSLQDCRHFRLQQLRAPRQILLRHRAIDVLPLGGHRRVAVKARFLRPTTLYTDEKVGVHRSSARAPRQHCPSMIPSIDGTDITDATEQLSFDEAKMTTDCYCEMQMTYHIVIQSLRVNDRGPPPGTDS